MNQKKWKLMKHFNNLKNMKLYEITNLKQYGAFGINFLILKRSFASFFLQFKGKTFIGLEFSMCKTTPFFLSITFFFITIYISFFSEMKKI